MSDCLPMFLNHQHMGTQNVDIASTIGIAMLLMSPITIIGNIFVLASIRLDPFKNIRSAPSSSIIFNLALADLLVGILAYPLSSLFLIYFAVNADTESYLYQIVFLAVTLSVGVSLMSLITLSVDRLIAIRTPLQYASRVTKKRITYINLSTWLYSAIVAICLTFGCSTSIYVIGTATYTIAFTIALIALNTGMILSVRTQAKYIKRTVDLENQAVLQNAFTREKAVTRTAVLMVVAFQVCLLPYIIFSFVALSLTDIKTAKVMLWSYYVGVLLAPLNSLINPFLYAWRLPKYRKAFRYILNRIKKKCSAIYSRLNTLRGDEQNINISSRFQFSVDIHHDQMVNRNENLERLANSTKDTFRVQENFNGTADITHSSENTKL